MLFQLIHHATKESDIRLHSEFKAETFEAAIAHVLALTGIDFKNVTLWVLPSRYCIPLDNPEALNNIKAWNRLG